jgi:hypothetical protein
VEICYLGSLYCILNNCVTNWLPKNKGFLDNVIKNNHLRTRIIRDKEREITFFFLIILLYKRFERNSCWFGTGICNNINNRKLVFTSSVIFKKHTFVVFA